METKNLFLSLKAAGETGTFSGLLSTYGGPPDLGGDTIQRGAFTKTLAQIGGKLPLLKGHDANKQLGFVKLQDSETGLRAEGVLNMENPLARETHSDLLFNLKHGIPTGLSIGYIATKSSAQKDGTRLLTEVILKEASYTVLPMNERALIVAAKQRGADDSELGAMVRRFDARLKAIIAPEMKSGRVISAANMHKLRAAHEHLQNASASHAAANALLSELMADAASGGPDPTPASSDDLAKTVASFGRRLDAAIRS